MNLIKFDNRYNEINKKKKNDNGNGQTEDA